jgi:NAD(P)-dependent dehydrogenase (short-subunit alcohol dehydrogenase family)
LTIRADVTNEKDVIDAINATVEKFGRIDYAAYVMAALRYRALVSRNC